MECALAQLRQNRSKTWPTCVRASREPVVRHVPVTNHASTVQIYRQAGSYNPVTRQRGAGKPVTRDARHQTGL